MGIAAGGMGELTRDFCWASVRNLVRVEVDSVSLRGVSEKAFCCKA
jgi:hypothetical protein